MVVASPHPPCYHVPEMNDPQRPVDYYRFCPGEERVKISDSICRGRRKASFPKCRGCRFNDGEAGGSHSSAAGETGPTSLSMDSLFRHDDVVAAVPYPLSAEVAWRIGHATAQYLRGKLRGFERAEQTARSMVVGRDTRPHGEALIKALTDGIRAYGVDVIDMGAVDTPQLHFVVHRLGACGGVQITGGQMPWDHNGFRFCGPKGATIGFDTGLASIRDLAARIPRHETGLEASYAQSDYLAPYRDFVRGLLVAEGARLPRPVRVVADASNGVAGRLLPLILNGIRNLTIIPLNDRCEGVFAHEPDPTAARNTRQLRAAVKQHRADFGICFDSDSSRCSFLDEKGLSIASDVMATLLARRMVERQVQAVIVFDLRCTALLGDEVERVGGTPIRAKADRSSIKKTMIEHDAVFGADVSGGFYFRDSLFCESAILALVQAINIAAAAGDHKLSELVRPFQRYRSSGEIVMPCSDPDGLCRAVAGEFKDAQIDQLDGVTITYPDWWFNLRHEAGQAALRLVLQARTKKAVEQRVAEVQATITARL